ncbi:MAG: hypothetical protein NTV44_04980 [Firmicutes bacterium]|nr:hypothetical protein [Bacillota bacterium]
MILIIGTTNDDILYFKTKMNLASTELIAGKHEVYLGTYSGKEVCVTTSQFSNSLSAMITGLCLEKYHPYLVINVGSVHAIDETLHQGDLFLAERIYLGDVDLTPWGDLKYGQICDMPVFYHSEYESLILSGICAIDTEAGGIAAACHFFDTPWITLKSISYVVGHENELVNFVRKGLEAQLAIGSIISAVFNELGAHD